MHVSLFTGPPSRWPVSRCSPHRPARRKLLNPSRARAGSVVKGGRHRRQLGDNGLEHCDKPMGAVAVVEPQDDILVALHALQAVLAGRPHSHDDPAVELLHRRRARRRHAEHHAGARAGRGR